MDWKLEVVMVPVSDVDRSKHFYEEQCGFAVDLDINVGEARMVQLTPPGSACSIQIANGLVKTAPGTIEGLQLVVEDVDAARTELLERGVPASEIRHFDDGEWQEGRGGPWNSFVFFEDPDGNGWTVQERAAS